MRTLLEFLRLHPHIAAQYESYLESIQGATKISEAVGSHTDMPKLPQGESVPIEDYMKSLSRGPEGPHGPSIPPIPHEEYTASLREPTVKKQ